MLVPVQPPLCIARASPTSLLFDELSPASIKLLDIIDAERMEIDLKKRHTPLRPHAQVRHTTNARTASEEPTLRHGMNSASVCGKLPPIIQGLPQTGQRNRPSRLSTSTTGATSAAAHISTAPCRYCRHMSWTCLHTALRILRTNQMSVLAA